MSGPSYGEPDPGENEERSKGDRVGGNGDCEPATMDEASRPSVRRKPTDRLILTAARDRCLRPSLRASKTVQKVWSFRSRGVKDEDRVRQ
jgi:hypothetical protein